MKTLQFWDFNDLSILSLYDKILSIKNIEILPHTPNLHYTISIARSIIKNTFKRKRYIKDTSDKLEKNYSLNN